jgi:ATP-dependent Clp protease, protease subunit
MRMRNQLEEMISRHSGQAIDKVKKDIDRDLIMTATDAMEYGVVDSVMVYRKKTTASAAGR